jgi:tartrate-resistant acid phosphatase type 5
MTASTRVADVIEQVCAQRGCEFALYLGDNFYDEGVDAVDDVQFKDKFEEPYADIDFPFYVVMGNHDYGLVSFLWYKADFEIEYTNYSDKWVMLDRWYDLEIGPAHFFGLDTTRLMWNHDYDEQRAWLDAAIAGSEAPWKLAFGHHPYLSNGAHGNAGQYEGVPFPSQVAGTNVKKFMDATMCGKIDVYFCGHDHNRQWLQPSPSCAMELIVSGAAAKKTDFEYHTKNPIYWEDDQKPGFMWVELDGDTMTGIFYDLDGALNFERSFVRKK